MYGGVAKTYCLWKFDGEPFKEGKYWYIMAIHPATKLPKKVRWYSDKAHADLMPKRKSDKFKGAFVGFQSKDDYILCIRDRDLSQAEVDQHFHAAWQRGSKWRFGMFFGGIWYAPKDAEIPPIRNTDKIFRATWPEFVAAAQAHSKSIGGNPNGFWFKEAVADDE